MENLQFLVGLEDAAAVKSVSHKSKLVTSRMLRIQSEILILKKQKELKEKNFIDLQKRQQEIDDLEIKLLQKQKEQLIKQKLETEAYLLEQQRINEENLNSKDDKLDYFNNEPELHLKKNIYQKDCLVTEHLVSDQQNELELNPEDDDRKYESSLSGLVASQEQSVSLSNVESDFSVIHPDQTAEVLCTACKSLSSLQIKEFPTLNGKDFLDLPFFIRDSQIKILELNNSEPGNSVILQKVVQEETWLDIQNLLKGPKNVDLLFHIHEKNFKWTELALVEIVVGLKNLPTVMENHLEILKFPEKLLEASETILDNTQLREGSENVD